MDIKNKIVLVTGGVGNFGKQIVNYLLNNNCFVIILDNNEDELNKLPINKNRTEYCCDITNEIEINTTIEKIKKKFKSVDILINNAGIIHNEPLVNFASQKRRHKISNWNKVINLNLTAPFILTSYIAELMISNRTKGLIINISSISANGNIGQTAYSASKAGLDSMTAVWSKELGFMGIRCVSISPGFIDTETTHTIMNSKKLDYIKANIPLRKLGEISNITNTIKFVIENDYLSGSVIKVDGGLKI